MWRSFKTIWVSVGKGVWGGGQAEPSSFVLGLLDTIGKRACLDWGEGMLGEYHIHFTLPCLCGWCTWALGLGNKSVVTDRLGPSGVSEVSVMMGHHHPSDKDTFE